MAIPFRAVLLNVPGTSSAAVTCIDGNAAAEQGRGGRPCHERGGVLLRWCLVDLPPYFLCAAPRQIWLSILDLPNLCAYGLRLYCPHQLFQGSFIKAMFSALLGLAIATVGIRI